MPKETRIGECAEWTLPIDYGGSILALSKHITPRHTSSILLSALANAINGSESAINDQKRAALIGCGANGGQFGVTADTSNLYASDEYTKSGPSPRVSLSSLSKLLPRLWLRKDISCK